MEDSELPEYGNPPVDEVALGVLFVPLPDFKVPHFGVYWDHIRDRYPKCENQPALTPQIESTAPFANVMAFMSMDLSMLRCWFIDNSGNQLIQVQPDRFIRNWRQVEGGPVEYSPA